MPLTPSDRTLLRKRKRTHCHIVETPLLPRNDYTSCDFRVRSRGPKEPRCSPYVTDRANSNRVRPVADGRNERSDESFWGSWKEPRKLVLGPVFRLIAIRAIQTDSRNCFVHNKRLFDKRFYFGNGGSCRPKFGIRSE